MSCFYTRVVEGTLRSLALFVFAGLLEIGDGYLVWLWLRDGRGWILGAIGGLVLFLYGVVPTLQPASFGCTYAAYGGSSSCSACSGAGGSTARRPIANDLIGAGIALIGVLIIFYAPRGPS